MSVVDVIALVGGALVIANEVRWHLRMRAIDRAHKARFDAEMRRIRGDSAPGGAGGEEGR